VSSSGGGPFDGRPTTQLSLGRFRLRVLANVCKSPCAGTRRQFRRQGGFGKEDQDLVSASATAKHASCCRCAKRRPGIRDGDRPLPSRRPLVHSLCDHRTRSRLADGEAGKIPYVGFYGDRVFGISRSDQSERSSCNNIGDSRHGQVDVAACHRRAPSRAGLPTDRESSDPY
jgi:hypothetical protein